MLGKYKLIMGGVLSQMQIKNWSLGKGLRKNCHFRDVIVTMQRKI